MIPLWLKISYTLLVVFVVIVYTIKIGPRNFLWFSDIALIALAPAMWFESKLIVSMMAVGVLLPEIVWNLSFFSGLFFGKPVLGLAGYMFDKERPLWLRSISLFHIPLIIVLVWLLIKFGYDPRALPAQTALGLIVLPVTYWLTDPKANINWVYGPFAERQTRLHPWVYVGLLMILFPLLIYLPTHFLLLAFPGP